MSFELLLFLVKENMKVLNRIYTKQDMGFRIFDVNSKLSRKGTLKLWVIVMERLGVL